MLENNNKIVGLKIRYQKILSSINEDIQIFLSKISRIISDENNDPLVLKIKELIEKNKFSNSQVNGKPKLNKKAVIKINNLIKNLVMVLDDLKLWKKERSFLSFLIKSEKIIFLNQHNKYIDEINKLITRINKLRNNDENNDQLKQLPYDVNTKQIESLMFNIVKLNSDIGKELNDIDIISNLEFKLLDENFKIAIEERLRLIDQYYSKIKNELIKNMKVNKEETNIDKTKNSSNNNLLFNILYEKSNFNQKIESYFNRERYKNWYNDNQGFFSKYFLNCENDKLIRTMLEEWNIFYQKYPNIAIKDLQNIYLGNINKMKESQLKKINNLYNILLDKVPDNIISKFLDEKDDTGFGYAWMILTKKEEIKFSIATLINLIEENYSNIINYINFTHLLPKDNSYSLVNKNIEQNSITSELKELTVEKITAINDKISRAGNCHFNLYHQHLQELLFDLDEMIKNDSNFSKTYVSLKEQSSAVNSIALRKKLNIDKNLSVQEQLNLLKQIELEQKADEQR
ncbi:hypothetical protein [Spiroplasma eriocheiris]|uniref:Uncharacterized protein n=1 Tax=Spiroplasma eriocheiris TaxID=315358 RepID=A0A0H3XL13_9MOLU|nr:hypothetical protein [Spiroplasma eriocheiris]AHF57723.1 hypothetical protein SPE_0595 [Spiroplasma eriocheiris CCTCC M 207170]AKM54174.1 hypothetical protein SERIO_v1c06030 [Spiroplasma eriocheiris]